jgi:hypothetical protein
MILKIADSIADQRAVTFSELSYGKIDPSSFIPFHVRTDDPGWEDRFSTIYYELLEELKRDDEMVGQFNPPYIGATHYPSLQDLMMLPNGSRMEFVSAFFIFDILRMLFREDNEEYSVAWIVSHISEISQEDGSLIVRGFVSRLR